MAHKLWVIISLLCSHSQFSPKICFHRTFECGNFDFIWSFHKFFLQRISQEHFLLPQPNKSLFQNDWYSPMSFQTNFPFKGYQRTEEKAQHHFLNNLLSKSICDNLSSYKKPSSILTWMNFITIFYVNWRVSIDKRS